jgi:putative nucleotidyltransferase with HDIG domain
MDMKFKITRFAKDLFMQLENIASELGMNIFVVGGYIRDLLLGYEGKDIDFVVIGNALDFAQEFKKRNKSGSLVVYPKFGTCMLKYGEYKLEFVTARKESYHEKSRKPLVEKADLYSDLSRRDFTINALAMKINRKDFGAILDVYDGQEDLKNKLIKTPLEPSQTFSDDPLRMMRAIRFASHLSFEIEKKTFQSIKETASRLKIVSQERITDEFNKILLGQKPSVGLELLDRCDLLGIFLPELVQTKGTEQRKEYHHKDVFYHTLQVLDKVANTSNKLEVRLGALFHDIAKPRTKRFDEKSGWTFHGHEIVGERMATAILRRMKYSNPIIDYVNKIVRLHLRPMALVSDEVTDSAIRRLLVLAGNEFEDLMQLCRADITSKNPAKVKKYLRNYEIVMQKGREVEERDKIRAFMSPVNGNEIIDYFGINPGPKIGKIKKFIEEAILDGIIPNEHDEAFKFMMKNKDKLLNL